MLPWLALIFAAPWIFAAGVAYGKRLERAESMTPKQAEAMLARAKSILMSPEEAVRNGEIG